MCLESRETVGLEPMHSRQAHNHCAKREAASGRRALHFKSEVTNISSSLHLHTGIHTSNPVSIIPIHFQNPLIWKRKSNQYQYNQL